MKLIGQIFAGALLGFLAIVAISLGTWKVWLRPAVERFVDEQGKKVQMQEIQGAGKKGEDDGEETFWAMWRNDNGTTTDPAKSWDAKPYPHMIVGLNRTADMLMFGPYPSQAQAQRNIQKFRDKYPDWYFIVAPIKR